MTYAVELSHAARYEDAIGALDTIRAEIGTTPAAGGGTSAPSSTTSPSLTSSWGSSGTRGDIRAATT